MVKKSRFVHVNGSTIIHCPVCRGVVLKMETVKMSEEKEGALVSRCPHCYESVTMRITRDGKGGVGIKVDSEGSEAR